MKQRLLSSLFLASVCTTSCGSILIPNPPILPVSDRAQSVRACAQEVAVPKKSNVERDHRALWEVPFYGPVARK